MVFGFPLSDYDCGIKRFRIESLVRLSPLPLPRPVRWCAQIAPAVFKLASLSLPRTTLMVPCAIIVPASVHLWIPAYFDGRTPVGAGVPDGPHRRTAEYRRTLVYPSVGAGVPDGPLLVPFMPLAGIFRAPARHPFARGGKRMQKRRQRPMVFGIPLRRT